MVRRVGPYKYPIMSLDEALERVTKLCRKYRGEAGRDTFAKEILERSPKSSMVDPEVRTIAQYGLIEARKDIIRATELAKRAIYGTSEEAENAKIEAVKRIELFEQLFAKYGSACTEENVKIFLREKGVEPDTAHRAAGAILKVYSANVKYLELAAKPEEAAPPMPKEVPTPFELPMKLPEGVKLLVVSPDYGTIFVKDNVGAELVRKILDTYWPPKEGPSE